MLTGICFVASVAGALVAGRVAHPEGGGHALPASVGVIVGVFFAGAMWVSASRAAEAGKKHFMVALYAVAIPWIATAGLVAQGLVSMLLRWVS